MTNKKRNRLGLLADALLFGGWALISFGVGRLNVPAGMIVAGGLAIAGGVLLGRGLNT